MARRPGDQLDLTAYVRNAGYHESAWRVSEADPASVVQLDHYVHIARTAERGTLDAIFLPDSPGEAEFRSEFLPRSFLDPLQLLSAVAARTERIGLIATASTTYSQPWDLARRVASLDHLSAGRAGWNIVTTVEPAAAANFGADPHPLREARYERAEEFVEVVLKLWDAWEDDALVGDRRRGTWADPARLHPPRHHGRFFDVASYLPFPRSPQGHPYLAQAGSSPPGVALAARFADGIFTPQSDPASARAFAERVRALAAENGRPGDEVRILPGLSFVLGSTEEEAGRRRRELEEAASGEFRWRNLANLAGLDHRTIDPDAPFPPELLQAAPRTSFGKSIYELAAREPTTFRAVAQQVSALPGGLDFTGTPEQLADLMQDWFEQRGCDGFTIMPHRLPDELERFVDHVVPILRARGVARAEYRGATLREHVGLPRPPARQSADQAAARTDSA